MELPYTAMRSTVSEAPRLSAELREMRRAYRKEVKKTKSKDELRRIELRHQEHITGRRLTVGTHFKQELTENWTRANLLLRFIDHENSDTFNVQCEFDPELVEQMVEAKLITVRPNEGVIRPTTLGKAIISAIRVYEPRVGMSNLGQKSFVILP